MKKLLLVSLVFLLSACGGKTMLDGTYSNNSSGIPEQKVSFAFRPDGTATMSIGSAQLPAEIPYEVRDGNLIITNIKDGTKSSMSILDNGDFIMDGFRFTKEVESNLSLAPTTGSVQPIPNSAIEQEVVYEKNGFPCVAELCVGDGLPELNKIEWQSVKVSNDRLDKGYADKVNSFYRGAIPEQAIPYLAVVERFDGVALPLLSGVTVRCSDDARNLKGVYTTKSGNETEVSIGLMPISEGSVEQQWTVMHILRTVVASMNNDQEKDAAKLQLSERYAKMDSKKARFDFESGSGYFYFDLTHSSLHDKLNPVPPQCIQKINTD